MLAYISKCLGLEGKAQTDGEEWRCGSKLPLAGQRGGGMTAVTGNNVSADTTAEDARCIEPWKTSMNSSLSGALTESRYFMYIVLTLKTTLF